MKKIIVFFALFVALPSAVFAQQPGVFLSRAVLDASSEMELNVPTQFFTGVETALYDTTLPTRIIASMNKTYLKTRLYARHGIALSVIMPGRPEWSGAIGTSGEAAAMDTGLVFEVASNTKTFVTALIMKLQDEGKLSIKDSIGKWLLKKYPNVDGAITIEQLLNHSSGIYDYLNDDPNYTVFLAFYYDPGKRWTPDSILFNHVGPPNFKPGTSYQYSNTNFMLAGLIAEHAGGAPLGMQLHKNFIDPLKLTRTFFGGEDSIPLQFAHNWTYADTSNPEIDYYDVEKTGQLSGAWAAGNIVATTGDLARWCNLLYTGQIVSKSALAQMMTVHHWPNGADYGLGTSRAPYGNKYLFGHGGSLLGFKSYMWTNPKDSISIALYMNSDSAPGDATPNDYVLDALNEIYRVIKNGVSANTASAVSVSAYPDPASEEIHFAFRTDTESAIKLSLYNELGKEVRTVLNEQLSPGVHIASANISGLSAGTYFYRLQSGAGISTGKIFVQ